MVNLGLPSRGGAEAAHAGGKKQQGAAPKILQKDEETQRADADDDTANAKEKDNNKDKEKDEEETEEEEGFDWSGMVQLSALQSSLKQARAIVSELTCQRSDASDQLAVLEKQVKFDPLQTQRSNAAVKSWSRDRSSLCVCAR
eukprot:2357475-Rhodomonas_salina.1